MKIVRHGVTPYLVVLAVLAMAASMAAAQWPADFDYTIGVSTEEQSGVQMSGLLSGPISPEMSLKVGGWWVTRSSNNRAFVGDAYVDYTKAPLYVAVGRKFVPFGPAGVLVSPGIAGGEVRLTYERVQIQAITGNLAFTPLTGGTRFTYSGNRAPSDESLTAARVQFIVSESGSDTPVVLGINMLDILDDTGKSADISIAANKWLTLYGESAEYADVHASAYGFRISNEKTLTPPKLPTILAFYHRKIPVGFVPAAVGASGYFENLDGWAGGLYQALPHNYAVGVFADKENAILTLFGHVDLQ